MNREEGLHTALCRWIRLSYPGVIFNSDLSGVRLHQGLRARMARLRSSRAFPDLMLYEQKKGYGGLMLELKQEGTRVLLKNGRFTANEHLREQAEMLVQLAGKGYLATFAVGIDEAMELVDWYMGEKDAMPFPGNQYLQEFWVRYGITEE